MIDDANLIETLQKSSRFCRLFKLPRFSPFWIV